MQLKRIAVTGHSTVVLPIFGALPTDKFALKSVDGLDSEVDVLISKSGYFQGRRPQNKELVLRIGLNPNYTTGSLPSDLRVELYGLLTPKFGASLNIEFWSMDNVVERTIRGYVKTITPVLFSKEPEVQVVISCLSPYLQGTPQTMSDTDPLSPAFDNPGTAPSGFAVEAVFQQATNLWVFSDASGARFAFYRAFNIGDYIYIDTKEKSRRVLHNGATMLASMDVYSTWLTLHRGVNNLASNVPMTWTNSTLTPLYWGV